MKTIHKLALRASPIQHALLGGATFLHVGMQYGTLCVWYEGDDTYTSTYELCIVGTGHNVDDLTRWGHVGTTQDGAFVWHVFARFVKSTAATDASNK